MARRKNVPPERNDLVAKIERFEQTYHISEDRSPTRRIGDEAIIDIFGTIEQIGKKHRKLIGGPFDASIICAREYTNVDREASKADPMLFDVSLTKGAASFLIYLPTQPFWALPAMISSGAVTHIQATYGPSHYGQADLENVFFATAAKIKQLEETCS